MQATQATVDPRSLRLASGAAVGVVGRLPLPPALPIGVEFRAVPTWPGLAADSEGNVWSCRRSGRHRKNAAPRIRVGGQWKKLKPALVPATHRGYLTVRPGGACPLKVHHVVLFAFVGERPEGYVARHLDDDRLNCRLSNLEWGTPAQNVADAHANGRYLKGEVASKAKLTEQQALEVRSLAGTDSQRALARRFGISQTAVFDIIHSRRWKHLDHQSTREAASA